MHVTCRLLHDNQLTGTLAPEFGRPEYFTQLKVLSLGCNLLQATLPPEWTTQGGWQSLETLNMSGAGLQGTLPDVVAGSLASLQTL